MTHSFLPVQAGGSAGTLQLPVAINYPATLLDDLPKYLLAPEVSALLHFVPDLHRKTLLATIWNTGARINEALALTRADFTLTSPYPYVQLATLKQRGEKAAPGARRPGRYRTGWFRCPIRIAPLSWR